MVHEPSVFGPLKFYCMLYLIATDSQLSHQETALNILGWIYKERGLTVLAKSCFLMSLDMISNPNAASLHLQDLNSIL